MSPEAIQLLRYFLGALLLVELGARVRHFRRRNKARSGCFANDRPTFADYLWVVAGGGAHYTLLAVFVAYPGWVGFAQLPFVPALAIIGCVLALGGLLLILWSHHVLGLAFCISAAPTPDQSLVTSGPYARVRHPIYLALVLKAVGVALATCNLLVIATSVAMLAGIAIRIPGEERRLHRCYGAVWDDYAARTPALFPMKCSGNPSCPFRTFRPR